jgi:HK97 gp10 family phage protein
MSTVEIKLTGFKELEKQLRELGPKVAKNGLRSSNYAGAKVVVDVAKQTTAFHDGPDGELRKSIWAYRRRTPDYIAMHSVALKGITKKAAKVRREFMKANPGAPKLPAGPYTYGRFIELGTSKMKARPFLRPAFLQSVGNVIETIRGGLNKAILRAVNK